MLLGLAFVGTGCDKPAPGNPGTRATEFSTNVTAYPVRGVLKEIRADGWKALITHEDIPGYMEAMTMLLDVKSTNELSGLQPGDNIAFRMLVTDTDGWIDRVKKVSSGVVIPSTNQIAFADEDFKEIQRGDPAPDCTLTNQSGRTIRLADFRGSALAYTFIFTRCPFPVYCPRLNNHFSAVQKELSKTSTATNWHLLSISFDPEYDTPSRLASYAKTYGHNPAHWSFATGATEDIRKLGSVFALAFWKEGPIFNHNVRTVVVDPLGKVHKVFNDNEWKPEELVAEMKKAMAVNP